jgi:hypothetical protein
VAQACRRCGANGARQAQSIPASQHAAQPALTRHPSNIASPKSRSKSRPKSPRRRIRGRGIRGFFCWLCPDCNTCAENRSLCSALLAPWGLGMGVNMIIDLDSWESGYADGRLGRAASCPPGFDPVSYASGYREAQAYLAGYRQRPTRLRGTALSGRQSISIHSMQPR